MKSYKSGDKPAKTGKVMNAAAKPEQFMPEKKKAPATKGPARRGGANGWK